MGNSKMVELALGNPNVLSELGDANGILTYKGVSVSEGVVVDTFSPLAFDQTYETLNVRSNWYEVPIYITDDEEILIKITSDELYAGEPKHSVSLEEYKDNITGMPILALKVINNGVPYTCYSYNYTDSNNNSYSTGWYDENGSMGANVPTFSNMEFNNLQICDNIIDLTEELSDKAMSGLDTISKMVNVSAEAMGSHGEKPDGVQRLNHAPQAGRRYAAVTSRDMTFPLPEIVWSGCERDFWLDLSCTSSVDLTFTENVAYEDGNNVDTTRGKHRLHFYAPAGADMWTVAETESYTEITEDYLPEYTIPFRNCTADQIRAVLKLGYSDGNGNWCVRRKGGIVQTWFSVGDTRPVTLTDGQEVTMRIIGIQHDDLLNGGKAALTCDFTNLVTVTTFTMTNSEYNSNPLRSATKNIEYILPDWLRAFLVPVVKAYNDNGFSVTDKLWAFSSGEVGGSHAGSPYTVFTDNASRLRRNANNEYTQWQLRTNTRDSYPNEFVLNNGTINSNRQQSVSLIAVGFCLNA